MADKTNTLTTFQQCIERAVNAIRDGNEIIEEIIILGYGASLTDADAQKLHPELTAAHLIAAKDALDAVNAVLVAGGKAHLAAMLRLRGVSR